MMQGANGSKTVGHLKWYILSSLRSHRLRFSEFDVVALAKNSSFFNKSDATRVYPSYVSHHPLRRGVSERQQTTHVFARSCCSGSRVQTSTRSLFRNKVLLPHHPEKDLLFRRRPGLPQGLHLHGLQETGQPLQRGPRGQLEGLDGRADHLHEPLGRIRALVTVLLQESGTKGRGHVHVHRDGGMQFGHIQEPDSPAGLCAALES
ncbi:hypothetical protein CEXT_594791 [Caerostris extrusa]|uniref:Uncharacterized protein n=1 Tax=Caerostris extrusa TaxID=172846 RepID=A0AAV4QKF7_CAEEX|nr:hypothetical protein CEXT_594791 [Caerostris extrusa]